jgi:carnitine O-acetyltransferase
LDVRALHFCLFGKALIKRLRQSPDSFVQMAIQAAFYRLHGVAGAHYETGGTRVFLHGRTDIIRSCSAESVAFASALVDKNADLTRKATALSAALKAHNEYAVMVRSEF